MSIQNLLLAGYTILNIKELILLFQNNLEQYKRIFVDAEKQECLSALHKLKGGLRLLQFSELINEVICLENSISNKKDFQYNRNLVGLIKNCQSTSNLLLLEINAKSKTTT